MIFVHFNNRGKINEIGVSIFNLVNYLILLIKLFFNYRDYYFFLYV